MENQQESTADKKPTHLDQPLEASESTLTPTHEGQLPEVPVKNEPELTVTENLAADVDKEITPVATVAPSIKNKIQEDTEIDNENAEDAEDTDNKARHDIPLLDYESMNLENLVGELQKLVRNEKIQNISKHVYLIKKEFDLKFQELLETKKQEFVDAGGNEIDFRYNSVAKRQFTEVYKDYREKKDAYHGQLEKNLKDNLTNRLAIIEELKSLINVEEDIHHTYKNFKDLQERWRFAGPVPRNSYSDLWRTYHHHVEIFYDFLHLNRELRDLDFKHNLEEKLKLIEKAEKLAEEPDLEKALRELQLIHKIWKEEIGPVGKEDREKVWERFSKATKAMHDRRQAHYDELDKKYEVNLVKKEEIINKILQLESNVSNEHSLLQKQIKEMEALREAFFKAGKVPMKKSNEVWDKFKGAVKAFNQKKNEFYKDLKKEQLDNLDKKKALLAIALSLKDTEDLNSATSEMKRIQNEWKRIGHVPRKYSDKIWNEFRSACNHYFDRLHATKQDSNTDEDKNLKSKLAILERLKEFKLSGSKEKDIAQIKSFLTEWKEIGHVPFNKRHVNAKFNRIIDVLFKKLDIKKRESELLRYGDKIKNIAQAEDQSQAIGNERSFIKRKVDEIKAEIRQLENNLEFFSNASSDNPLVKDVIQKIENQKEGLALWKAKLKNLNILENKLERESNDEESENEEIQE